MPKKGPFFFYMLDFKDKLARKGKIISMAEVSTAASPSWNRMTAEQRKPYELMAKTDNSSDRHGNEKLSAHGVPMALIQQYQEDKQTEEERMKRTITELVQNSYFNNCIETQSYYFIMGNHFCKTSKGIYIPAELAVVEYSLRDGLKRSDFWYLKKDKLPEGYAFTAKSHSELTHRMPIPPDAMGIENWSEILKNLIKFITDDSGNINSMFTFGKDLPMMKSILSQLCDSMPNNTAYDVQNFDIFSATQLLFTLKREVCKYGEVSNPILANGYPSIHIANDLLERDNYDYTDGLACTFHEEHDASKFCALSCCKRLAYMISDNICKDLNIEFIPGRHLPLTSEIENYVKSEPSGDTFSTISNASMVHSQVTTGGLSSNYTQPKFEKKRYNTDDDTYGSCSSAVDIAIQSQNEFPSLGGLSSRKTKKKQSRLNNDDNNTGGGGGDGYSSSSTTGNDSEYFKKSNVNSSKPLNTNGGRAGGGGGEGDSSSTNVDDNNPWGLRMKTAAIAREPNEDSFQFTTTGGSGRGSLISNLTQSERSTNICLGRGRNLKK